MPPRTINYVALLQVAIFTKMVAPWFGYWHAHIILLDEVIKSWPRSRS